MSDKRVLNDQGYYERPMITKAELLEFAATAPLPPTALFAQADRQQARLDLLESCISALNARATLPENLVRQVLVHLEHGDMEGQTILALLDAAPDGPEPDEPDDWSNLGWEEL